MLYKSYLNTSCSYGAIKNVTVLKCDLSKQIGNVDIKQYLVQILWYETPKQ